MVGILVPLNSTIGPLNVITSSGYSTSLSRPSTPVAPAVRFSALNINQEKLQPALQARFTESQPFAQGRFLQMLTSTLDGLKVTFKDRIDALEAKGVDLELVPDQHNLPVVQMELVDRAEPTLRKGTKSVAMSIPPYLNPDPEKGFYSSEAEFYQSNLTSMVEQALAEGEKQAERIPAEGHRTFGEMVRKDDAEEARFREIGDADRGDSYRDWLYRRSLET